MDGRMHACSSGSKPHREAKGQQRSSTEHFHLMVVWTRKKCGWNSPNWLRAEPLAAKGKKKKRNEDFQVAGRHKVMKREKAMRCDRVSATR
ncbi:hypothetical protein HDV57DRAFT_489044 [Trichoderma longibrachiatum]|uniref:Uncharacterized protein n=1 Tax=Trichoderma longibrachiatum ATCC 18648 TaxID=983965 RepID=A0A2T4BX44_TRILO|nr:hypothetical protein M440DRAFT_1404127 [Trichoderma longibrachiatum ATCC 18648]